MIDYYYEFEPGAMIFGSPIRFAVQRGYHPEFSDPYQRLLHQNCYQNALRIWLENDNGITMVKQWGRNTHLRCHPKEITWLKLQARELD
jgi:hypothetical protein